MDHITIEELFTPEVIETLANNIEIIEPMLGLDQDEKIAEIPNSYLSPDSKTLKFLLCDVNIYTNSDSSPFEEKSEAAPSSPDIYIKVSDLIDKDHEQEDEHKLNLSQEQIDMQNAKIQKIMNLLDELTKEKAENAKTLDQHTMMINELNKKILDPISLRSKQPMKPTRMQPSHIPSSASKIKTSKKLKGHLKIPKGPIL